MNLTGQAALVAGAGTGIDVYQRIFRTCEGIPVHLGYAGRGCDREVGPRRDSLERPYTLQYMRIEFRRLKLAARLPHGVWMQRGAKDVVTAAADRVRAILAREPESGVVPEAGRERDEITAAARGAAQKMIAGCMTTRRSMAFKCANSQITRLVRLRTRR